MIEKTPQGDDRSDLANLGVLIAVILLIALAVWVLIAFKHSSDTLDCLAAHHHDCAPAQ